MMTVPVTLYCDDKNGEEDCDGSAVVTGTLFKDGTIHVDAPNGWKDLEGGRMINANAHHKNGAKISCPRSHK